MSISTRAIVALLVLSGVVSCRGQPTGEKFPDAGRDVAPIVSDSFSTEDARDRVGEAEEVVRLAGVAPGMSVADIGAGEGYYTVRLSPIVGSRGRVLAQDIVPATRDKLAQRVEREHLDNVAVRLGEPANPMLPAASFDRIFMVHMYHEVTQPYAFLWHLRAGLKPGGLIVMVDADRPVKRHGMPHKQTLCEFAALGLEPVRLTRLADGEAYFMAFKAARPRPAPASITSCRSKD